MSNPTNHQWASFYKGRLHIKACSCCGQMSLATTEHSVCNRNDILLSPVVKAGYTLRKPVPILVSRQRVA